MSAPDVAVARSGPGGPVASDQVVFGVLGLAGVQIALPLTALREVVPCPAEFAELPASAEGLLGAMSVRELVVPVLDLRARLGAQADRAERQVVVIITREDQVLGLLADEARGMTQVASDDLRAVSAHDGSLVFSHTFHHPAEASVVSVLDVPALMGLPGVPSVHDPAVAGSGRPAGAHRRGGPRRTLTLLRCGPQVLGIEVAYVHTTLADARPQPSVFTSPACQGVTEYMGLEVPVVDPLFLLGLGELPAERTGAGLVLNLDEGYVVLALSEVVDIVDVAADAVLPLPAFSVRRAELLAGIVDVEGPGQCLVVDGDALLADGDLQAFASMNTPVEEDPGASVATAAAPADADAEMVAASAGGRVYLTYSVGPDVATPLEQISEIVALPDTRTLTGVGDAVLGIAVHRDSAVPVLCLRTLLGLPEAEPTSASCLLLVSVDGEQVGFAVDALRAIDPLSWEKRRTDDEPAEPVLDLTQALRSAPLVSVGEDTRLLPDLDLRAVARTVRGAAAAPAA